MTFIHYAFLNFLQGIFIICYIKQNVYPFKMKINKLIDFTFIANIGSICWS